jgi:phage terminase large subunit-like protein
MRHSLQRILVEDYESFARKAYREDHGAPLGDDPYVTFVCDGLQWLRRTDGGTLVVNLPPRHGKTLLGVVYHVAWLLGRNPRLKIIVITYGGELAEQITWRIRQVMRADFYREIFGTRLEKNRQRAGHFVTTEGGSVFATSVNGVLAGIGADYIFADDLLSLREANDPEKVEAVNRIFDAEITSRLNTPSEGRIVVIAHRLHENDLSAHLKDAAKTRHIVLPLVAVRRKRIRLSTGIWVREKGELLRAGSHSKATIEKLKLNAEPTFEMLYQQGIEPSNVRLTEQDFRTYNRIRLSAGAIVISVDTAVKEGPNNSFTVMQVWAPRDQGFFLVEQVREQSGLSASADTLHRLIKRHRPNVVLIEDRASGTNLIEAMRRRTSTKVFEISPGRDSKAARLAQHVPLIRKRPIFLPEDFLGRDAFVDEVLFRSGYSDQLDAMTQMLQFVSKNPMPQGPPKRALIARAGALGGIAAAPAPITSSGANGIVRSLSRRNRNGI